MAKELFGAATLATVLGRAKRFAFGSPSQNGADNIVIGTAIDEIRGVLKLGNITSSYTTGTVISGGAIVEVHINVVSGTPTLKIGSTSGGEELMQATEALSGENYIPIFVPCYASKTIYPRVTGAGTLTVTLVLRRDLF